MIEEQKRAYLEAMDIPVWVSRHDPVVRTVPKTDQQPQPQESVPHAMTPDAMQVEETAKAAIQAAGLKLGPGAGGVLLLCTKDSDSSTKLANDISRALGKMPVWGWPDAHEQAISASDAVEENLFTCVAVFGEALGHLLFGNEIPVSLGSAKLVLLPAMSELTGNASARSELWSVLCRSGMIVS